MRELFRALRVWSTLRAASKGPGPLAKLLVRRRAHRTLATTMRKHGL